jgi:hypothetical protein
VTENLPEEILAMRGMSGRKYRLFINNLVRMLKHTSYLEVGSWTGSTLCSAINGNTVRATAIDNWTGFGGPKSEFMENLAKFKAPSAHVNFVEKDFREVDFSLLGKFQIYMFDGPHGEQDQYDGILRAEPAFEDKFVLITDDWNWPQVRKGTLRAISDLEMSLLFSLEIRTTLDDSQPDNARGVGLQHGSFRGPQTDWHNGYFIAVLERNLPPSGGMG